MKTASCSEKPPFRAVAARKRTEIELIWWCIVASIGGIKRQPHQIISIREAKKKGTRISIRRRRRSAKKLCFAFLIASWQHLECVCVIPTDRIKHAFMLFPCRVFFIAHHLPLEFFLLLFFLPPPLLSPARSFAFLLLDGDELCSIERRCVRACVLMYVPWVFSLPISRIQCIRLLCSKNLTFFLPSNFSFWLISSRRAEQ